MPGWVLHRQTVTVLRVSTGDVDVDGVQGATETAQNWTGCQVQPQSSQEQTGGVERETTRLLVSGDLVPWLTGADKVVIDATTYRVEGEPKHYTSVLPHTEAIVVAWKGQ